MQRKTQAIGQQVHPAALAFSKPKAAALVGAMIFVTPGFVQAQQISVKSEIRPYEITLLQELPPAPEAAQHNCVSPAPVSPAAQAVAALGWQVVHESALGPYRAVTFVAGSDSGSLGLCAYSEGNVALYRGDKLTALVWSAFEEAAPITMALPVEDRLLRLYTADYVDHPVADLVIAGEEALVLRDLPQTDRYCGGTVALPLAWGKALAEEAGPLAAAGWRPRATQDGTPAPQECSGTGVGYCLYLFDQEEAELRLTTYGGTEQPTGPMIAEYEVTCKIR